jgi:hypothetical protein
LFACSTEIYIHHHHHPFLILLIDLVPALFFFFQLNGWMLQARSEIHKFSFSSEYFEFGEFLHKPPVLALGTLAEALPVPPGDIRDSVVGIATGYGLDNQGVGVRIQEGSRIFSFPRLQDLVWVPTSLISNG